MTDEKRGRGRPPLADEDRRDARLEVRLSAAEAVTMVNDGIPALAAAERMLAYIEAAGRGETWRGEV